MPGTAPCRTSDAGSAHGAGCHTGRTGEGGITMTAIQTHPVQDVAREVHRLTVDTGMPFAAFRERYERAVPPLDMAECERLRNSGADWAAVLRAVAENAPHGF